MALSPNEPLLATAACAAAITMVAFIGKQMHVLSTLAGVARLLTFVADMLTALLGLGTGAHGGTTENDVASYILTFILWWTFFYFVYRWWTRRAATSPK